MQHQRRATCLRSCEITELVNAMYFRDTPWADFTHSGTETGGLLTPFNTLAEGVAATYAGQTITLKPGSTTETILIDTPVRLTSFGGPATAGN